MNPIKQQLDEKIGDLSVQAKAVEQYVKINLEKKPRIKKIKIPMVLSFIIVCCTALILAFYPKEQHANFDEWLSQEVFEGEVYRNYILSWYFSDEATVKHLVFEDLFNQAAIAYYAQQQGIIITEEAIHLATIQQQQSILEAPEQKIMDYLYQKLGVTEEGYAKTIIAQRQKLQLYQNAQSIDANFEDKALATFSKRYDKEIEQFKQKNNIIQPSRNIANTEQAQQMIDSYLLKKLSENTERALPFTPLTLQEFELQAQTKEEHEQLRIIKQAYDYDWQALKEEHRQMKKTKIKGEVLKQKGNRYLIVNAHQQNQSLWIETEQKLQLGQRAQVFEDNSVSSWQALRYPNAQLTQEEAIAQAIQNKDELVGIKSARFEQNRWDITLQHQDQTEVVRVPDERR